MSSLPDIKTPLVLYGTLGCHLCEIAEQQLAGFVTDGWQVELIDIADDDILFDRFSLVIPVLEKSATGELIYWPFDADALQLFLSGGTLA